MPSPQEYLIANDSLEAVSYTECRNEAVDQSVFPEFAVTQSECRTKVRRKLEREPELVFESDLTYNSEEEMMVIIVIGGTQSDTRTGIPCLIASRSP